MDGARWYAIYDNGEKILENDSLPKKGLLALDTKKIREFGLESEVWRAHFLTCDGSFFFNNGKIKSALPGRKLQNFDIICHNKVVIDNLANNASKDKYVVFGYKMVDEEASLIIISHIPAYLFLRKRKIQNKWTYCKNNQFISSKAYNFLLYF